MPPTEKVKKKRDEGEGGIQEKGKEEASLWWGAFMLSILLTLATRLYKVNLKMKPKFRSFFNRF